MEIRIERFKGDYRFLSNFFDSVIVVDGIEYRTVEHAFQAAKTTDPEWKETIRSARTPGESKRLGKEAPLRPGWEAMKVRTMLKCLREKFKDETLRTMLLATGDAELIEGNTWGDTFWGVWHGKGSNMLGKLLMKVREEIKGGG